MAKKALDNRQGICHNLCMATTTPHTEIRVRRTDGSIETIVRPGTIIDPQVREQMTEATRVAGRGEIIGWTVIGTITMTANPRWQRRQGCRVKGCQVWTEDQGCSLHGTY